MRFSEGGWTSCVEVLLVCCLESLAVLVEVWELFQNSLAFVRTSEEGWVAEATHVEVANPEVTWGQSAADEELSSSAVWVDNLQELWKGLTEAFGQTSGFLSFGLLWNAPELVEEVVVAVDEHVVLVGSDWVIGVVAMLLGEESYKSSSGTSFVSISGLEVRHGTTSHRGLEWRPVLKLNTVVGEGDAGVVEHESDWLSSAVPIEIVNSVFGVS